MGNDYTCSGCGAKFESQKELEKHIVEEHPAEENHEGHDHD